MRTVEENREIDKYLPYYYEKCLFLLSLNLFLTGVQSSSTVVAKKLVQLNQPKNQMIRSCSTIAQ